jgi:peptidyl-prolyl cis-trans isomerase D
MNNSDKNVKPTETKIEKKEKVSVLEAIRRRTALLVGIVGLALVIFILESLLGSGSTLFGGNDGNTIGRINGHKIDRVEFSNKLENQMNMMRQQRQGQEVDDATKGQIIESIWQQYVNEYVVVPQYNKIGISVGEDELYDKVVAHPVQSILQQISDPKTGKLSEQFARPDGSLDVNKWKQAIQSVTGDQEAAVKQMEDNVKQMRLAEKYATLIRKGIYTTTPEAKELYKAQNTKMNISYVIKRYDSVSDSAVKVTDADLEKYYKENSYEFYSPETTRKIEYVAFNVMPSQKDLSEIEADAQRAAAAFKGLSPKEDTSFISQESENGAVTIQNFTKKTMIVRDSSILTSAPGAVFGPYNEGAYFKIYKLESVASVADSAKVRHILIGTLDPQTQQPKKSRDQAKREADSLLTLIKNNTVTFDTLVKTVSDDGGSKEKGGDYGWFDEKKGFVEPFTNAGLMGVKGNISVVETQFGFHIIEVLDVSNTRHQNYKVAQIFKLIAPSEETNQTIFTQANEFAGKNNTADLFDKAVDSQKLTKRIADNIKESDRQLPALEGAKELVRWAYSANKGEVNVFSFKDKYVVAKLTAFKNKGVLPLEDIKEEISLKVKQQKKAEQFQQEFATKAGSSKAINDIASKLGLEVKSQENLSAMSRNIEGLGRDDVMIGAAIGTKAGATSKVLIGDNGVFVVMVNSSDLAKDAPQDIKMLKQQGDQASAGRADYEAYSALKEISDIEDHKSLID